MFFASKSVEVKKSSLKQISSSQLWKTVPLAFILFMSLVPTSLAQEKRTMLRTLTVTGKGTEEIPATIAQVNLGVEVEGKKAQEVQQEVAKRSSAVLSILKSRKVNKLKSSTINLSPVYKYTNNIQTIIGYRGRNSFNFRIDASRAGKLLDDAIKAGATRINGISFVASDAAISQAQKSALQKATKDAQQQANAVFSTLGFQAKEIISIQINNASAPQPIFQEASRMRASRAMPTRPATPIEAGKQQVKASVTLKINY